MKAREYIFAVPASDFFDVHRSVHCARQPDLSRQQYPDELCLISGLVELPSEEFNTCVLGEVPTERDNQKADETKYLWVVAKESLPIMLEQGGTASSLQRGRLSHTNLTSGADAHTAGELWFIEPNRIAVNGGSSRYGPRSKHELDSAVDAFKRAGYHVASMGWDDEVSAPVRILRGDLEWI